MLKYRLIRLVRMAQSEGDPQLRKMLWDLIEEVGLPPDATVVEAEEPKEKPRDQLSKEETILPPG